MPMLKSSQAKEPFGLSFLIPLWHRERLAVLANSVGPGEHVLDELVTAALGTGVRQSRNVRDTDGQQAANKNHVSLWQISWESVKGADVMED